MQSFSLWHWIIVALIAYFTYLVVRRPRQANTRISDDVNGMSAREAELILNAYGKTLEHLGPIPGSTVADENKLPFPKDKIKAAILFALATAKTDEQKAVLKNGFFRLQTFSLAWEKKILGLI